MTPHRTGVLALGAATILALSGSAPHSLAAQGITYPISKKGEVVDDLFGAKVPDPYRWMEELNSPEVAEWVRAQNTLTEAALAKLPQRDYFRQRITALWNYPKVSLPYREAGRLFFTKNSGLQRQSALYSRKGLDGADHLVIDPNELSPDGSVAISGFTPSPDGRYLLFGMAQGGSDWRTLVVRELDSGRQLSDTIRWLKGGGASWTKDGNGFFYSRFPEPEAGKQLQNAIRDEKLYYHAMGTPQSQDRLIYERRDHPDWFVGGEVSDDGRWLFIFVNDGTDPHNRLYVKDLGDPKHPAIDAEIRALFDRGDASYTPVGTIGHTVYIETDLGAPKHRIASFDAGHPDPSGWRILVPEATSSIAGVQMYRGGIAVSYLEDVAAKLRLFALDGAPRGEIPLPGVGSVGGVSARSDSPDLFYAFTSPLYPTTAFRYDPATKRSTPFEAPKVAFDPSLYETRQLFAPSRDGTKVPLFITMKRGLALDGSNPAMLYGYGGFDISTTPSFRPDVLAWLELGGIWATASMRGGGEYGETWHHAGMFEKKQNVFDDFLAAADYLVKEHYSSPAKLGIMGGSNGGLLVGAAMEQRPELFAVALPAVGVMDMLRYHKFTGGKAWATEYGSADDSTAFRYLVKYSPLHNIKAGTCYPATLVTTADHDDRVVPSHSFKFTAALQAAQGCDRPVLIRVEAQGSHGYRPTDKAIAERADQWAFTAANMGVKAPSVHP
ncbi:MAG: prolyl oligopeptidase family serine peptidase [Gemmatimonadota bacterium]|nr:prolyl oligopeptidase family serine peptidase [Gemmatimonadota bacterium]